jgi:cytochrome c biogenesis protein CcmG, thiol:disulfide interchange protein DsbE
MSPRLAVLAGLLSGILVAALVLGGVFVLAPEGSAIVPTASPEPSPSVSPPSPGPSAGSSGVASGGPSASPGASASGSALFGIGEPAPPLVVPQVGGGGVTIDLAALKGKPVWVNFMATWCPSCQDEFPLMNGFAARYAADGLVVLAIDVKEDEGTVAAFAESLGATFPLGLDSTGSAQADWDALALPVHFWVDADGIVRDAALGGIGPDIMASGLQSIMPGVTVTP